MSWQTKIVQLMAAVLLSGLTGGIISSIAAFFFDDRPFAISLTALPYRVILLSIAIVFDWDEGGKFIEMHLWIVAGIAINLLIIRQAAAWLYDRPISK